MNKKQSKLKWKKGHLHCSPPSLFFVKSRDKNPAFFLVGVEGALIDVTSARHHLLSSAQLSTAHKSPSFQVQSVKTEVPNNQHEQLHKTNGSGEALMTEI